MGISTVLFDLDDTLIDSSVAIDQAINAVFESDGLQHISGSEFSRSVRVKGRQLAEAFHELETREGLTVNLLPLYRSAYWHRSSDLIKLYPNIENVLIKLYESRMKLGIVTQKLDSRLKWCFSWSVKRAQIFLE